METVLHITIGILAGIGMATIAVGILSLLVARAARRRQRRAAEQWMRHVRRVAAERDHQEERA
ncbi:MAG: hypothetical protein K6W08_07385 [Firmicutes bacterium]|nr:hypothetical protein [Bacillota bacterium]